MKKLLTAIVAVALPVMAFAQVEGTYKTQQADNGESATVKIAACGSAICGTIVSSTSGSAVGTKIVWDMKPNGANSWTGGKILDPSNDKTYNSKMSLSGNSLKVSGCVAGGLICKSQTWTKVN